MARVSERRVRHSPAPRAAAPAEAPARHKAAAKPDNDFAPASAKSRAQNPLKPDEKATLVRLTLAHPTATNAELAKLFAAEPTLAGRRNWTEAEVTYLRDESHVVPSERRALAALGPMLVKAFAARPKTESLPEALAHLSKQFPRVDRALVLKLARTDRALAKATRPLWMRERELLQDSRPVALTAKQAASLDLGREALERGLAKGKGSLVDSVLQKLVALERNTGNNDGLLAARDVLHADPLTRAVMAEVQQRLGSAALPLADIEAALPSVVATLAERGRGGGPAQPLMVAACEETLAGLVQRYQAQVIEGGVPPTNFAQSERFAHARWKSLVDAFPAYFPPPEKVRIDEKRLDAISALYGQLMAGDLEKTSFYGRARITVDELQLLQAADPERFPKDGDTPFWRSFRTKAPSRDAAQVKALSKDYVSDVVQGQQSRAAFLRSHGLAKGDFEALQAASPELFPTLGGRWGRRTFTPEDMAHAVGAAATKIFQANVLTKFDALLEALNADEALVKRFGEITPNRYGAVKRIAQDEFPDLKDMDVVLAALAKDVKACLAQQPDLTPSQLVTAMQRKYPTFELTRIYQLRDAFPGLIPEAGPQVKARAGDRERDARALAAAMKAHPEKTLTQHARSLARGRAHVTKDYLARLRKDFSDVFVGAVEFKPRQMERSNLVWARQLELVGRLLPPGSGEKAMVAALNKLLAQQGLMPYGRSASNLFALMREHGTTLEASTARVTAEVVAEYARAAPKGATQADVFGAVLRDYPTLTPFHLSTAVAAWKKAPGDYPALKPFFHGHTLSLSGRGEKVAAPRFLGGWDVERALLGPAAKDPALAKELAGLSQFTRMPGRLPLLDASVDDLKGATPLRGKNFLWVTHALGSTVTLAHALKEAGLSVAKSVVVSSPYGTNDGVGEALREEGFDLRTPPLDTAAYRAEVEKAVDAMVKLHRKNHQPVVVMDDGGLVAAVLHSKPEYADVRRAFKIVEQTNGGITYDEQLSLETPVVSMAGAETKKLEGPMVGRAVAAKTVQALGPQLGKLAGRPVTVVGYGTIGSAVAEALAAQGAKVTVVESSPAHQAEAREAGYTVKSLAAALSKADVVVGTTGRTSVDLEHLKLLHDGAVFLSASSKQVEFAMDALDEAASRATTLDPHAPIVRLPNVEYTVDGKTLVALGDGWPINFDGDVNSVPVEEIQITRALMFECIVQAAGLSNHARDAKGLIPFEASRDEKLMKRWAAYLKEHPDTVPVEDPRDWADVLRRTVATIEG
ncbi:MAG: NAD-binding protein [Myxococcaceae bacterium]|nr:NAD-binding protein [Myxococcaceae bacterium]